MTKILFGPAGIPIETPKPRDTAAGIAYAKTLGLNAFELEFVRSVNLTVEKARIVGEGAKKLGMSLSTHAPYYINLLSKDPEKLKASKERILNSARSLHAAGGSRVVFHSGYFGDYSNEESMKLMKIEFKELLHKIKEEKLSNIVLAPEVTGGQSEWAGITELYELANEFGLDRVNPCIDWSHQHCRTGVPTLKHREDFQKVLDQVEKLSGKKAVETLHCHAQCVRYGPKGEIAHLPVAAKEPDLKPLMEILAHGGYGGTIICESPEIEKDALVLKKWFDSAK
ncbi:MAG TPA: TIM barrel protein [Candidatus Norongarragalinales archaeon]|jgi:deoxyribonuclease-4|nr:TIM barrel protein [Candidatus Norongarragalinales archaeon]